MKDKLLKITIFTLMIIIFMQLAVFANTLTLNISTNKQSVKAGEKFKVIVSWKQGMQAADFYLKYDSEKLKFIKTDISDDYINSKENGKIKTAWFSMDDTDKTKIEYTFKAKKSGIVEFETKINGGFATGELKVPSKYEEGKLEINVKKQPLIIRILKVIVIIVGIVIIILILRKTVISKKKNKKGSKEKNVKKYFK